MSPAAAHSVILSQRRSSRQRSALSFPSSLCLWYYTCARSKPFLSTATRSHTPLSNPALFSYFLRHTSNTVLTWTLSLRKPHTDISAHFIPLFPTWLPCALLAGQLCRYLHASNHVIDPIQLFKSWPLFLFLRLLTLQFSTFAVKFSPLLSQVGTHTDRMGRWLKPAKKRSKFHRKDSLTHNATTNTQDWSCLGY